MTFFQVPCNTNHLAPALVLAALALLWCSPGLPGQSGPQPVPAGFTAARAAERYGTAEHKLQNGSIFDYMDGGGIIYLEHAFRELEHREYSDPQKRTVSLDIFTLATAQDALAALADERIAPPGGSALSLPVPGRAFHFSPDYFVYLVVENRLYYFHISDDRLAETLNQFIRAELAADKEKKQ
jgi:hypothetical protein